MDETPYSLIEHLTELRQRVVRIFSAWFLAACVAWFFREEVFSFLLQPAIDALGKDGSRLQAIAPPEIFLTYLKVSLLAGFVLSIPVFFWQAWAFVAPGLYAREKKFIIPFVLASTLLFVGGASFGYTFVFPVAFGFFANFSTEYVESAWTMREVYAFTSRMFLAFGIAFELPVVVVFLSAAGIVNPRRYLQLFPYAVVGAFVMGAILTPQDVPSMILLAFPLIGLYLIGTGVAFLFAGNRFKKES